MDALSEVASICHFVESDKVTERKVVWKSYFTSFLHYFQ